MTENFSSSTDTDKPHLLISSSGINGLQTLDDIKSRICDGFAKKLWQTLLDEADRALKCEPYLPTSNVPGRAPHHIPAGNRDFVIVDAVCKRLKNDALVWLITKEQKYLNDALRQLETLFDETYWPQWPDQAHLNKGCIADLRTGMLMSAIGYSYDWLYIGLSTEQRKWIIDNFDRRAIQPYLSEVRRNAWFTGTDRMNNWNTVIAGGAGIMAMVFGNDYPLTGNILDHALNIMNAYLEKIGPDGEFNESAGYAGAMHCPIDFFSAYRYHTHGVQNKLAEKVFKNFCRWYMYCMLPPGRSVGFGDGLLNAPPKPTIFSAMAAANNDGISQWFYHQYNRHSLKSDHALELLYYNPSVKPVQPDGNMAYGRAFRNHGAEWSCRTDWNPEITDCVVYGKAGHGNECHGHHDCGQVCIDAFGKPMVVDLGHPGPSYPEDYFESNRWKYYNAGVLGHNVMMFNGKEMLSDASAQVIDAKFDDSKGGYWICDTTSLYEEAVNVRRAVIHLYPGVVAVLDFAALNKESDISLRWHTANKSEPDSQGRFTVLNDDIEMSCMTTLIHGTATFARREHAYSPPFDKARLGFMLEQRHESYVETFVHASSCMMLSLFYVSRPGYKPSKWFCNDANTWRIKSDKEQAEVYLNNDVFTVCNQYSSIKLNLDANGFCLH